MAEVRYEQVTRTYPGTEFPAVDALDLAIEDGEFMVLVGPSGSGKTTALRMLAGLEEVDAGAVRIGGRDVTDLPPKRRDVAMVFQNYALYPYLTVAANIGFPLKVARVKKSVRERRVQEVANLLGLSDYLDRKPGQLSGGQRQRVALGRAIVREPMVFLFDEPLSNLDAKLRLETRAELARLHRRLAATMVYVTHDQEEALTLGTRVAVMNEGRVEQVGPPLEVYRRPETLFVATFVGSPAMNLLPADLLPNRAADATASAGGILGVRPHDIAVVAAGSGDSDALVDVVEPRGSELLLYLRLGTGGEGPEIRVVTPPDLDVAPDRVVGLRFDRGRLHLFDRNTGRRMN
jgi:multiple sugar transport system ATP-binding protein